MEVSLNRDLVVHLKEDWPEIPAFQLSVRVAFVSGSSLKPSESQLILDAVTKGMKMKIEQVQICSLDEVLEIQPELVVSLDAELMNGECLESEEKWKFWNDIPVIETKHPSEALKSKSAKKEFWADLQLVMTKLGI